MRDLRMNAYNNNHELNCSLKEALLSCEKIG